MMRGHSTPRDRYQCSTHGVRRRVEVRQAEVDEVCVYVCRACGQVADEMWQADDE